MTYDEAIDYLFNAAPLFQNIGAGAYKEGLSNTRALDEHFGHPHRRFRTIHVAGTNGKGSVSHTLAAILQKQGFKVGLYTSPHLIDFRERIRVNGEMMPESRVVTFVEKERSFFEPLHPSFFELATALAFSYFAEQKVDFAVIEVGLGGRLDCTNIIQPELSVITNISFDHVQFLGDTLPKIASEKAGIIKSGIPVCIGENVSADVKKVFADKADEVGAPILFAEDVDEVVTHKQTADGLAYETKHFGAFTGCLTGLCQTKNTATILTAVRQLRQVGIEITDEAVRAGFADVVGATGLMGRWQVLAKSPYTVCDTAHNIGGLQYIVQQLSIIPHRQLHLVFGMVNDKDIEGVLSILPTKDTTCYFTQASVKRAMAAEELQEKALKHGLSGNCFAHVTDAYDAARENAAPDDIIYIGGSTFVVADMLKSMF